jgi:glycosyltransferase involved in cell wall biosynthesis
MSRFGIDAHVLTGKHQGSRTVLFELLGQIARKDAENTYLIYSYDPDETRRMFPVPNFEHRPIPVRSPVLRLLFFWPWARVRDRIDVLLTQYNGPPLYPGRQAIFVHDILFETHPAYFPLAMRWRLKLLTRWSARLAARVFVVSAFSRDEVMARYRLPAGKVTLVRNGFNATRVVQNASAPPSLQSGRYILCVGRLEPRKNVDLLVRAYRRIVTQPDRSDLKLVLVGRGDFSHQDTVRAIEATAGVIHIQDMDAAALSAAYRHASVFAYPTLAEGFGLPLLEAIAHGVPVVSSNTTALPETGGDLARYFDPTAADAEERLVELLNQALDDPHRPSAAAAARHLEAFDWGRSAEVLIRSLDSIPARPGRG